MDGGYGAMIGATIGAVQDTIGGVAQTAVNAQFADQSWKRQKKAMQNAVRWRVADLRAAGLNPILAAGGGLTGSAPGVATPQSADFRTSGSVANAAKSILDAKMGSRVDSEIGANNARKSADEAAADLSRSKKATEALTQEVLAQTAEKEAANARSVQLNNELLEARIPEAEAQKRWWQDANYETVQKWRGAILGGGGLLPIVAPRIPRPGGISLDSGKKRERVNPGSLRGQEGRKGYAPSLHPQGRKR